MVRISSGRLKGRKVAASKKIFTSSDGDELRPTSSKVREAIFDIVRAEIDHALFLDLYAGTGAVGLEALSRGAEKVYFVESSLVRAKAITDYIRKTGLDDRAAVYREKAETFLQRAMRTGLKFDIIFADPPYQSDEIERALPCIAKYSMLKDHGCILVEHFSKTALPAHMQNIKKTKDYKYGGTIITLYRKEQ
ncbi:MAG: 16S rRNA (guanine(966)-N(2))-methyltransferase RsmD [Nitrospira bacterium HGW-Nitrospira-1]|nr:MAG: 16S rRNA (guanine(966)-N(2))-methyltransferase RsmD [Nitrospira bacterium HGW-Nitrospira-1]